MKQIDNYTKGVLTVIAAALIIIAVNGSIKSAKAQDNETQQLIGSIGLYVAEIANNVSAVSKGTCINQKICS